jgi:uncharacterized repeat protein (TIGR01451 family)
MRHHALDMPAVVIGLCLIAIALLAPVVPVSHAAPLAALTQTAEPPTSTPTTIPSSTATALPTSTATAAPSAIATSAPSSTATVLSTSTPTAAIDEPAAPGVADPAVIKQADLRTAAIGDLVTFTLTVTNNGNRTARGVVVEDSLPSFLGFVSARAERGQVVQSGTTIGFWIGDVAPGELVRCIIVTRVLAVAMPPDNRNSVRLSTTSGSDNLANNTDMVELNISPASEATASPAPSAVLPTAESTVAPAPSPAPPAPSAAPIVLSDRPAPAQLPVTSTSAGTPTLTLLTLGSLLVVGGVTMSRRARRAGR